MGNAISKSELEAFIMECSQAVPLSAVGDIEKPRCVELLEKWMRTANDPPIGDGLSELAINLMMQAAVKYFAISMLRPQLNTIERYAFDAVSSRVIEKTVEQYVHGVLTS